MKTRLCVRPGNPKQRAAPDHVVIRSFDELD